MSSHLLTQLLAIESRRQHKDWEPKRPVGTPLSKVPPTIYRSLCLRSLEIPVQEWTEDYLMDYADGRGIEVGETDQLMDILSGHSMDETKHDTQLNYLAEYWGGTESPRWNAEIQSHADTLAEDWMGYDEVPSIVKKMVLEAGVFFPILGMMAVYAKDDLFTQSVREWITSDENAHVASSRILIRENGYRIPIYLTRLVDQTVRFVTADLPKSEQARWLRVSSQGLRTGVLEDGAGMSVVSVPESFTQTTNQRISYQSHS